MKTLTIKWQRVESEGKTCPRCEATGKEIEKAIHTLKQSMAPLGIEVILEKKVLTTEIFGKDVSQSNRIWIGARPLEDWLGAKVGQSPCPCEVCGEAYCRTLEIEGAAYETISAAIIIKAALMAASQLTLAEISESCCAD